MPKVDQNNGVSSIRFLPRHQILSFEEIVSVAKAAVSLGIKKIRVSGGEPLLRHDLPELIFRLSALKTSECKPVDLAMTTNGVLLAEQARILKQAGLSRVTVSLDALSTETFQKMTGSRVEVSRVLEGITTSVAEGLSPVKVNMVVQQGVNETEILPMIEHFRHTGGILRFIEFMDVGTRNGWSLRSVFSVHQIIHTIARAYDLIEVKPNYSGEVARRWVLADGSLEIGVVASVSQPFCGDCSRLRLSTDGQLYTCLFANRGTSVRHLIALSEDEIALSEEIEAIWRNRNDRYSEERGSVPAPNESFASAESVSKIEMYYIGG